MTQATSDKLTEEQVSLLPNDADRAFYAEHGYWISPVIIPAEIVEAAGRGMARFYAGERDGELKAKVKGWKPEDGDVLRKNEATSFQIKEIHDLVHWPTIGATAAALIDADVIRLWHDQLLYKPVDSPNAPSNIGWHTDRQYWKTCTSDRMLTAWVGFHAVDENNGSVGFMDGSNRWDDVDALSFFNTDLGEAERRLAAEGKNVTVVPTRMKVGQVSFHDCRTIHGSGPNKGPDPRRGIAIHLQDGDNRWRFSPDTDGNAVRHHNDALAGVDAAGNPDYTDESVFPVLYQR